MRGFSRGLAIGAAIGVLCAAQVASAQPGMSPPGRTPPGEPDAGPYGPPGPAGPGATPPPPPPPNVEQKSSRRGLVLGGSAGFGARSDGGFAGSLYIGGLLSERLALVADAAILASVCDSDFDECTDEVESLGVVGGGVRLWLGSRFWLHGTLGVGFADTSEGEERGLGWTAGTGIDLITGPSAALDLRVALIGGFFEEIGPVRATIGVGITIR